MNPARIRNHPRRPSSPVLRHPSLKRVHHRNPCFGKIAAVTGGHRQAVGQCGCGDHAVLDRHRFTGSSQLGEKCCPTQPRGGFPRQADDASDASLKPAFELLPSLAFRQKQDAELDLAENDRIHNKLALVTAQPLQHSRIRCRLGGLAKDVGRRCGRSQRVGGFRGDGNKEPFRRTGEKPVHQSFVRAWSPAHEAIFTAVQPFNLKPLSRFNAVLPANLRRKDDLAFAGNTRCHAMQNAGLPARCQSFIDNPRSRVTP